MDTAMELRRSRRARSWTSGPDGTTGGETAETPEIDPSLLGTRCVGDRLLSFAAAAAALHALEAGREPYDAALPSSRVADAPIDGRSRGEEYP